MITKKKMKLIKNKLREENIQVFFYLNTFFHSKPKSYVKVVKSCGQLGSASAFATNWLAVGMADFQALTFGGVFELNLTLKRKYKIFPYRYLNLRSKTFLSLKSVLILAQTYL